jgi:predicted anti-sigma-YlaC factor YlaD
MMTPRRKSHHVVHGDGAGCDEVRLAVSARLDGEAGYIPDSILDGHLAVCERCRTFRDEVGSLTRQVCLRVPKPAPEGLVPLLVSLRACDPQAAIGPSRQRPFLRRSRPGWLRVTQWTAAGAPAVIAIPALALGAFGHPHIVASHVPTPCTFYLLAHHVRSH